jgi:hypothetical protein
LRIESWAVNGAVLGTFQLGDGWSLEGALGVCVEIVRTVPTSVLPGGSLAADFTHALARFRIATGIAWERPRIAFALTLDVGASDPFVYSANGVSQTLFSIDAVRPGVVFEIGTP